MTSCLATPGADAILNGTALPSTLYLQGHTGDPGTNGTSNVATETDRIAVTPFSAAAAGATGYRAISNTELEELLDAAANETWTHITLWSASTNGTCWFVVNIADIVVADGNTISLDIGALVISLPVWT